MTGSGPRRGSAALSGVSGSVRTQRPWVAFCARCGRSPARGGHVPQSSFSRVCGHCGMGLVLRAPDDVAPAAGDAFLVVDRALAVCAVSEGAEEAVGITEPFAIGRLVSELVLPERGEPSGDVAGGDGLLALVRRAVLDGGPPRRAAAHVAGIGPGAIAVRIGPCGPPRAALVVLEP